MSLLSESLLCDSLGKLRAFEELSNSLTHAQVSLLSDSLGKLRAFEELSNSLTHAQVSLLSDSVGKLRASEERLEEGREDLLDQLRGLERRRTELETHLAVAQRQEAEMRLTLDKVTLNSLTITLFTHSYIIVTHIVLVLFHYTWVKLKVCHLHRCLFVYAFFTSFTSTHFTPLLFTVWCSSDSTRLCTRFRLTTTLGWGSRQGLCPDQTTLGWGSPQGLCNDQMPLG